MRVNLSIDDALLKDLDSYCEKYRYNRSELLSRLIREAVYGLHTSYSPEKKELEVSPDFSEPEAGFCEGHFERGKTYPLRLMEREDENGTLLWTKKLCAKCIKLEEDKIRTRGGVMREKLLAQ